MCLFVMEQGYDVAVSGRGNSLATGTCQKFRIESTFGKLIGQKPKVGRKGPLWESNPLYVLYMIIVGFVFYAHL